MENSTDDWGSSSEKKSEYNPRAIPVTEQNKFIYKTAIYTVSATSLISVFGMLILPLFGKEIPQAITAIGSVAIGALAGLFTQSR